MMKVFLTRITSLSLHAKIEYNGIRILSKEYR